MKGFTTASVKRSSRFKTKCGTPIMRAARRATERSSSVQHRPSFAPKASRSWFHGCIERPTTSAPSRWRRSAATDESTPPDMATATRIRRILVRGSAGGARASRLRRARGQFLVRLPDLQGQHIRAAPGVGEILDRGARSHAVSREGLLKGLAEEAPVRVRDRGLRGGIDHRLPGLEVSGRLDALPPCANQRGKPTGERAGAPLRRAEPLRRLVIDPRLAL